jgi:hypothetical protein
VLISVLDHDRHLLTARAGLLIIADKGYASAELDDYLHRRGVELLRPAYRNRAPQPGQQLLAPIRQLFESVNDTLKGQLDLELHGGRTLAGVSARIAQRLLALSAALWLNRATGQPITRSLIPPTTDRLGNYSSREPHACRTVLPPELLQQIPEDPAERRRGRRSHVPWRLDGHGPDATRLSGRRRCCAR